MLQPAKCSASSSEVWTALKAVIKTLVYNTYQDTEIKV